MVVLPGQQGKGIGKALAQEVTRMADKEGRRCYLESSRDVPNIKIYESMGFRFVKQMDCDDNGEIIKLYCMWVYISYCRLHGLEPGADTISISYPTLSRTRIDFNTRVRDPKPIAWFNPSSRKSIVVRIWQRNICNLTAIRCSFGTINDNTAQILSQRKNLPGTLYIQSLYSLQSLLFVLSNFQWDHVFT